MLNRRFLNAPNQVCFSITKRCNLKCKHCCSEVEFSDDELTFEEIVDIIDQLEKAKVFQIQVFGGEPFLRKDLFDILKVLRSKHFDVCINTNCTLIKDSHVKQLLELKKIGIATSLDGSCPEIHDKLRGKGAFEKAVAGIKKLVDAGYILTAETVVTRFNIKDLIKTAEFARSIGIRTLSFVPVFYGGQAKCFQEDLAPTDEDFILGREIANELLTKFPKGFVGGGFIVGYQKIEQFKKMIKPKDPKPAPIGLCGAARMTAGIRADAQVIPCSALWEMPAGSLRERSFMDIWRNSPVLNELRNVDKVSLGSVEGCKDCEFNCFCNGNCRASALYYSGSIYGFTPDCHYFRETHHEKIKKAYSPPKARSL